MSGRNLGTPLTPLLQTTEKLLILRREMVPVFWNKGKKEGGKRRGVPLEGRKMKVL